MGAVKRAYLYITRKKARSILLFGILFVMGIFLLTGLSIRAGAKQAADEVRRTITTGIVMELMPMDGSKVYELSFNEEEEIVRSVKIPILSESQIEQLLKIEGVEGYFTEMGYRTLYTGLDIHPGYFTLSLQEMEKEDTEGLYTDLEEIRAADESYMHCSGVYAVEDGHWHPFFANGALELTEGRNIELGDRGKAVISEELAARNGLQIGDTVEFYNFDFISGERYGVPFESEIIGIFQINFEQDLSNWTAEDSILANVIFSDPSINDWEQVEYNSHYGRGILAPESERAITNLTLFVEDPEMLDSVQEQITSLSIADWSYYNFKRYDGDYKAAAKPLRTILTLSTILVIIIFTGTFLILSLILTMWIRSRKREVGILISIGTKKKGILSQFILECFFVALAAFLLAGLLAVPLTNAVGRSVQKKIEASTSVEGYEAAVDYQGNITINKLPSGQMNLEYALRPVTMLSVLLAMLLVSIASVAAASRQILKQKPREALKGG